MRHGVGWLVFLSLGCGRVDFDAVTDAEVVADGDGSISYRQAVLADSPVAYWRFGDTDTTAADESPNHTSGMYVGGVSVGAPGMLTGDPNTAASFAGNNGKVAMGALFGYSGLAPCTFEAWVRPNVNGMTHFNVMSKIDNSNGHGYLLYINEFYELVLFRWEQGGTNGDATLTTPITNNVVSHVVFTYDGAYLALYIDAVLRGQLANAKLLSAILNPLAIGHNESNDCCYFKGVIDEVAIYDHALSQARITAHHRIGIGQ